MRIILLIFLLSPIYITAQSNDEEQIKVLITTLFDGVREKDSLKVSSVFAPEAELTSVFFSKEGKLTLRSMTAADYAIRVTEQNDDSYDEKIWSYEIHVDRPLASVWTEYSFYLNGSLRHCGVNSFDLILTEKGWKICDLKDTRRRSDCREE